MVKIVITRCAAFALLCAAMASCGAGAGAGEDSSALATITFYNYATYPVDIFYNFNPQSFDPTTCIGTADASSRKLEVQLPASTDALLGDTFYIRFKILLANRLVSGTTDIYTYTERTMSNISFVIESGGRYSKIIENPPADELRFTNGVVIARNFTNGQVWIENHGQILPQLGRETAWLEYGEFGYYELPLPFLTESVTMSFLQSRNSNTSRTPFPEFEMERGKKYYFEIKDTGIEGPKDEYINEHIKPKGGAAINNTGGVTAEKE